MNNIKISIIVATYNADKTLHHCLSNIIEQKTGQIELIVIDGRSHDRTVEIIQEFSESIDFWISENDRGIYDAWNKGIAHSRGEWLLFIGADDALRPNAIQVYLEFLATLDSATTDYVCGKNLYVGKNGSTIKTFGDPLTWKKFRHRMNVAHVASLHSRNLFLTYGVFDTNYRICGDYELLLRKGDQLRAVYLDAVIAEMSTGGMSYSAEALFEGHSIRTRHSKLPPPVVYWDTLVSLLAFWLNRLRANGMQ